MQRPRKMVRSILQGLTTENLVERFPMADHVSTPIPVLSSSAGAVRRRPSPQTAVEVAHCGLVAAVTALVPCRIIGTANRFDVMRRAQIRGWDARKSKSDLFAFPSRRHAVAAIFTAYAKAIVADTAHEIPVALEAA
jgi:hypothetical protein